MAKKDNKRTGGQLLVDSLLANGVEQAFCVPGESYLAVLDAFYDAVIVRITMLAATILHAAESRLLDANFDRLGFGVLGLGSGTRRLQNGWVQFYGGWAVVLVGLASAYFGMSD